MQASEASLMSGSRSLGSVSLKAEQGIRLKTTYAMMLTTVKGPQKIAYG